MNYYESKKNDYIINPKYSSINLFNDNLEFIFKNMKFKIIILSVFLVFLQILPFIIIGDFDSIINSEITNYFDVSSVNQISSVKVFSAFQLLFAIITFFIQRYFTMDYFVIAKNQKFSLKEYLQRFFKGILKSLSLLLMLFVFFTILTFLLAFLLIMFKIIGIIIYFIITLVISFFVNIIEISIFDDTRLNLKYAFRRAKDTFLKKEFVFKFLFGLFIAFLSVFTINNILLFVPNDFKLSAVIACMVLNSLISLIISGYLITLFIFYSEHIKYYLDRPFALDYSYEPYEVEEDTNE